MGLEERLALVAKSMMRDGLVQAHQDDGWPWAFTVPEAATFLGVSVKVVRRMVSTRRLRACQLSEPVISATQMRGLVREIQVRATAKPRRRV